MSLRLLLALLCATLPACDLLEPLPDEPPPGGATHPYGEGNGKVVFLSDLADAERIDVTLGGEPIGAVTRFTGCPGRVTTDDSLAVAIRPAGTYQYAAQSTTGLSWATSSVTVTADEIERVIFVGRPSRYAVHLPAEIEGFPVPRASTDTFHLTVRDASAVQLRVGAPTIVQGDRVDLMHNGDIIARDLPLGTSIRSFDIVLTPGPNYVAVRLSHDPDGDGSPALVALYEGDTRVGYLNNYDRSWLHTTNWAGLNVRYAC